MTSTFLSKLSLTMACFIVILGCIIVSFGEPAIVTASNRFADLWRYIVMVQAGAFIGILILCATKIASVRLDKADHLLRPLAGWALCSALLAVFGLLNMISYLHSELTWRTPMIFLAFIIGDVSAYKFLIRVRRILRHADLKHAVIKLTLIDTHYPGPLDTDMDSGHQVTKNV